MLDKSEMKRNITIFLTADIVQLNNKQADEEAADSSKVMDTVPAETDLIGE